MNNNQYKSSKWIFVLLTALFFLWALSSGINGILISHFQTTMHLSSFVSGLVDTTFYFVYFIMVIPVAITINKTSYKSGILIGLILFTLGSFLFYPAATAEIYLLFLVALLLIACGLTFLETCASSYMARTGDPKFIERRLSFAHSFNGLGFILSVYLSGDIIFGTKTEKVYLPFLIMGTMAIILFVIFAFTKLPDIKNKTAELYTTNLEILCNRSHLYYGVAGIFFYLGAQTGIWGYFLYVVNEKAPDLSTLQANNYYSLCFIVFMLGRFVSTWLMHFAKPVTLLNYYALSSIVLLVITIFLTNIYAVYSLIMVSFFMSAMYPIIFGLSLRDMGQDTKIAASFLMMALIGGGIFPPIMGLIIDKTTNTSYSLFVPIICFMYISFFAIRGHRIIQN